MRTKDLCDFCGGELKHRIIDLDLKVKGKIVICKGVPADVCGQCGEPYLDANTSAKIDLFLEGIEKKKPIKYVPVPVFPSSAVLGK